MGSQNGMTIQTTEQVNGAVSCSGGAKVEGCIGGIEPHSFLGNLYEAPSFWKETVWMDRVNKVHDIQTRQGFLRKAGNQGRQEDALV